MLNSAVIAALCITVTLSFAVSQSTSSAACPYPSGLVSLSAFDTATIKSAPNSAAVSLKLIPAFDPLNTFFYYSYAGGPLYDQTGLINITFGTWSPGAELRVAFNNFDAFTYYPYQTTPLTVTAPTRFGSQLVQFEVVQNPCAGNWIQPYSLTIYASAAPAVSASSLTLMQSSSSTEVPLTAIDTGSPVIVTPVILPTVSIINVTQAEPVTVDGGQNNNNNNDNNNNNWPAPGDSNNNNNNNWPTPADSNNDNNNNNNWPSLPGQSSDTNNDGNNNNNKNNNAPSDPWSSQTSEVAPLFLTTSCACIADPDLPYGWDGEPSSEDSSSSQSAYDTTTLTAASANITTAGTSSNSPAYTSSAKDPKKLRCRCKVIADWTWAQE